MRKLAVALTLVIALYVLATIWAAAEAAGFLSASNPPANCQPMRSPEGFPAVSCPDGAVWYLDMDGQPYANDAGNPVYAPGVFWIKVN